MWGREVDRHNADKGQAGGSMVPVQLLGCMPSSFKHFNSTQMDLLKMQQLNQLKVNRFLVMQDLQVILI